MNFKRINLVVVTLMIISSSAATAKEIELKVGEVEIKSSSSGEVEINTGQTNIVSPETDSSLPLIPHPALFDRDLYHNYPANIPEILVDPVLESGVINSDSSIDIDRNYRHCYQHNRQINRVNSSNQTNIQSHVSSNTCQ